MPGLERRVTLARIVSQPSSGRLPIVSFLLRRRTLVATSACCLVVLGLAWPYLGGAIAKKIVQERLESRFGLHAHVSKARAGWRAFVFHDVELTQVARLDPETPRIVLEKMTVPFSVVFRKGQVRLQGARVIAPQGLSQLQELRARLLTARSLNVAPSQAQVSRGADDTSGSRHASGDISRAGTRSTGSDSEPNGLSLVLERGRLEIGGEEQSDQILAADVELSANEGGVLTVQVGHVAGRQGRTGFEAKDVRVDWPLRGLRPKGLPEISIHAGRLQALPQLALTGIEGVIRPSETNRRNIDLAFSGSYGGADETLWRAEGRVELASRLVESQASLRVWAERFRLGRIASVLPQEILTPERTSVDATLALDLKDTLVTLKGHVDLLQLNLYHQGLAAEPVEDLDLALDIDVVLDPIQRLATINALEGRLHELVGRIAGSIKLVPGSFSFPNGQVWSFKPRLDLAFDIPRIPCGKLLNSFPRALVPHLQDFRLRGVFETHLETVIDYADLENLSLDGRVGIDGCRVMQAPFEVEDMTSAFGVITQTVEIPAAWDSKDPEPDSITFFVGPQNPEFVPFEDISEHMINAVLSTEDARFFRHRGFATTEFKTALRRNLARGGFRLGASSITMQTVKNLLLSHEKTLSRKLQELFLVWYVEQRLTKERILELYLNAIEFGPRLYGIGPAAVHYFGKEARALEPSEAVFLATLLPSPKRRYATYCRGTLSTGLQRHIKRILARMREREYLDEDVYAEAVEALPVFDLSAREMSERQCLAWVERMVQRMEADGQDEPLSDAGEPARP